MASQISHSNICSLFFSANTHSHTQARLGVNCRNLPFCPYTPHCVFAKVKVTLFPDPQHRRPVQVDPHRRDASTSRAVRVHVSPESAVMFSVAFLLPRFRAQSRVSGCTGSSRLPSFLPSVPVPWPLLIFHGLDIFFGRLQTFLGLSDVSSGIDSGSVLMEKEKFHSHVAGSFSACHVSRHVTSRCPVAGEAWCLIN